MDKIKIGNKEYLSIESYAKLMGVTIQTVYNRINSKQVKVKRVFNQTFVLR